MIHNGLSVDERMSDLHFARQGRKFNRRNTLSTEKPGGGKVKEILSHHKRTSSQHLSPLFAKLPYEIRTRIFQQALFDTGAVFIDTVPITSHRGSLHKLRVRACELELGTPPGLGDLYKVSPSHLMRKSRVDTALLRTCRLVYKETLPMLYAQTRFVFKDPRHLVAFSHSIPRTHFEHIRSIRLDFSEISKAYQSDNRTFVTPFLEPMQEFLGVVRLMRRLRSIYIVFRIAKHMRVPRSEVDILLEDMQEYQERIIGATFEQCETHLLVFFWAKLVHQRVERGLLEVEAG
ncbi:uncharacterized protein N0V89_004796 [Didymosphaeria variabile]|uniref:DUF7730 domain-containing protein n=1 Tax=Didymosphaeria variabile TaxID=1932322 RepID=A0A9W8XQ33_9PLEO|nr:uncharacterized protein N0V89_004796 [Didymosphaeria variabile]KAJ4356760.1 hypothetical protein N0V89_004796 [Didymosphaeria variabile]